MQLTFRSLLAGAAFILAGCAGEMPTTRAVLVNTTINRKGARLLLDTGSDSMWIDIAGAKRLGLQFSNSYEKGFGLKFAMSSEPAEVTMGGRSFKAPIPVVPFAIEADGVVGWPEVRDNILVFDADHRTIHSVKQLPPETTGWLKLKIMPGPLLLLQTPLADGAPGTILVDTGSPDAVQMPPAQWKRWKANHPEAPVTTHRDETASFGSFRLQVAWADEIKLGALTLTDVAVDNMESSEGVFLQKQEPAAQAVWGIGMYALMRMDMVVDGKNGFAYLNPKPPPGPSYPGVKRPGVNDDTANVIESGDWTVADDVRLGGENLFMFSASDKWLRKDYDGALADYTRAIELTTNNPDAYSARGEDRAFLGDMNGAIADFSRAIELNPNSAAAYSDRGMAREVHGDFSDAVSDYDKVIELKPDDTDYERLYRQILLRRLGRPSEDFAKIVAAWKHSWTKTIGLFLAGALDEKALLKAAKKSDIEPASGQKCEALYYIGIMRLNKGDKAGAREVFQKCRATNQKEYEEYQFAGAELARL